MSWSDGDEKIILKWNGAFRLSDDEKDIAWMEDGARLTDRRRRHLQVDDRAARRSNGRIERTFSKNGMRRDYEPEGRAFLAAALDQLIKRSGMFAKERVAKYLKRGGPDAVLAEIAKLGESELHASHLLHRADAAGRSLEVAADADPAARARRRCRRTTTRRRCSSTIAKLPCSHRGASRADRARGEDHLQRLRPAPHADGGHGRAAAARRALAAAVLDATALDRLQLRSLAGPARKWPSAAG